MFRDNRTMKTKSPVYHNACCNRTLSSRSSATSPRSELEIMTKRTTGVETKLASHPAVRSDMAVATVTGIQLEMVISGC